MSGDHNMNQTDSGWRKRQIALDIKAENARELGLDYEPVYTEAYIQAAVQAEREACAKVADGWPDYDVQGLAEAIRARGQA